MVVGVGTDIVEVKRIGRLVEKFGDVFLTKILCPDEIRCCNSSANRIQKIAARFAAKEALAKALGTGIFGVVNFQNVEISSAENGAPFFILHDEAAKIQRERQITHIHVSLSHTESHAISFVVLESSVADSVLQKPKETTSLT
ncbi:MAG: holo-ACP synthase [Verrucomicrobia bacterium]|nr:holo-ACP synthase [Verrucomicrobiota bacterium]